VRKEYTSDSYVLGSGEPAVGLPVLVALRGSRIEAELYDAETGGNVLPNPLDADADGKVTFWIEQGYYTLWTRDIPIDVTIGDNPTDGPGHYPWTTGPSGAKGEKGDKGDQGDTGPQGPAGPAGADGSGSGGGSVGPTGPQGPVGPTGPAGPQGPKGAIQWYGNGAPGTIVGAQPNDLYLDKTNGNIYKLT
jgi:hypothetical protein